MESCVTRTREIWKYFVYILIFFVENYNKELPAETQFSKRQRTENCLEWFRYVTHSWESTQLKSVNVFAVHYRHCLWSQDHGRFSRQFNWHKDTLCFFLPFGIMVWNLFLGRTAFMQFWSKYLCENTFLPQH